MNGLRPVVEIQVADFIFPAFNQLVNEAARMYYRTNGEYSVPLVIRAPYGAASGADCTTPRAWRPISPTCLD